MKCDGNGKGRTAILLIAIVLGCLLLVSNAAAVRNVVLDISNPDNPNSHGLDSGPEGGPQTHPFNFYNVTFRVDAGLQGPQNAIFIIFDQYSELDEENVSPECILVSIVENDEFGNPSAVQILDSRDEILDEFPNCTFPAGVDEGLKLWLPDDMIIPANFHVWVNITCGVENDCPIHCGNVVWAATDLERFCPVESTPDFLQVTIDSTKTGECGNVSPEGLLFFDCGEDATFIFTPGSECCNLTDIFVDNVSVEFTKLPDGSAEFTFEDLACSHTIRGNFTPELVNITAKAGDGGIVRSPDGVISPPDHTETFNCGSTPTYMIIPDVCFFIKDVTVDGVSVVGTPGYVVVGSSAEYTFPPVTEDHVIEATFTNVQNDSPGVFLLYQVPQADCGCKKEILIEDFDEFETIGDAVDFADDLYIGGDAAIFNITGDMSGNNFGGYDAGWNNGSPVGDSLVLDDITFPPDTEEFQIIVNKNDGTQDTLDLEVTPSTYTISGTNSDIVKIANVVGIDPGFTPQYQSRFEIDGLVTDVDFGDFGITLTSPPKWASLGSLGEMPDVILVDLTGMVNPETYIVTYIPDTGMGTKLASLTITPEGDTIWAPIVPSNIVAIADVVSPFTLDEFTWQLLTEPPFATGGLVGGLVRVPDGVYAESFEIDTPGLIVESMSGPEATVIDGTGVEPVGEGDDSSLVFITCGGITFEGFTVENGGVDVGGAPDDDHNGLRDVAGIVIHPNCTPGELEEGEGTKCGNTFIDNNESMPACIARVNIVDDIITGNQAEGIAVHEAGVLIDDNVVCNNLFDGIAGDFLVCCVEVIDPHAFTHGLDAMSEIIDNVICNNGGSGQGQWTIFCGEEEFFSSDGTDGGKLPGWIDSGIEIRDTVPCCGTLYIVNNTIVENVHAGINLFEGAESECVTILIEQNQIIENGIFGISNAMDPTNLVVKYNNIVGNRFWGIKNFNELATPLIAKENFWGMPGGPSRGPAPAPCTHQLDQRSDALGNGNAISHNTEWNPWLFAPWEDVFAMGAESWDGIRMYGSDSLELQQGWNTFSVPVALWNGGDQPQEFKTFGDFVTPDQVAIMYYYDAKSDPPQFRQVQLNTTIIPGQGYYINMKTDSRFPVLYWSDPNNPGLSKFDVVAGWNLIGAPWGIDRVKNEGVPDEGRFAVANPDIGDPEAVKDLDDALESIKFGQNGKGVAILISPSVPGQIDPFSVPVLELPFSGHVLFTGEAYWVFMVNPSSYGGFEVTPFFFNPTVGS